MVAKKIMVLGRQLFNFTRDKISAKRTARSTAQSTAGASETTRGKVGLSRLTSFLGGVGVGSMPWDSMTETAVTAGASLLDVGIASGGAKLGQVVSLNVKKSLLGDRCIKKLLDNGSLQIVGEVAGYEAAQLKLMIEGRWINIIGSAPNAPGGAKKCNLFYAVPKAELYDCSLAHAKLTNGLIVIVIPPGKAKGGVFQVKIE